MEETMKAKTTVIFITVLLACNAIVRGESDKKILVATGLRITAVIDPGQMTVEPSSNTKVRGMVLRIEDTLIGPAADLVPVIVLGTMNCNLDRDGYGPCWGTFALAPGNPSDTPAWEGVFEGSWNMYTNEARFKITGHADGLKLEEEAFFTSYLQPGIVNARVFDSKSK
jgi:hypothetical protein